ncbi:MAG: DUF3343 domain-containing protein [Clostridia bacterium]|nr:DUF3343 domain-containing protein [Clostridia bacterium]
MIKKEPALVFTFHTGTEVFQAKQYCMDHDIPVRIIPVPGKVTVGCGMALRAPADLEESLPVDLMNANLSWDKAQILAV